MASDPSQAPAPSLRLSGPGDLLAAVPYLLGFVPRRSLVVVAIGRDRRVALVARVDLVAGEDLEARVDLPSAPAAAAQRAPGSTGATGPRRGPLGEAEPPPAGHCPGLLSGRPVASAETLTGDGGADRVGLPPSPARALQMAERLGPLAARAGASAAVAVLYPAGGRAPVQERQHWRAFARSLREGFGDVELLDCLAVADRRWWSLLCEVPGCCPAQGQPMPAPGTSGVEASAVLAGLVAFADRADMVAALAPAAAGRREPVAAILADESDTTSAGAPAGGAGRVGGSTSTRLREDLQLVDRALLRRGDTELGAPGAPGELTAAEAAALIRAVCDPTVRDAVSRCQTLADGHSAVSLWAELASLAPDAWLPGPASLLAAAAYQCGNGVLATAAAEAVLAQDPGHVLAGQLARALAVGISPSELAPMFRSGAAAARVSIQAMV